MTDCARKITWAGGTHVFDLGRDEVLAIMAGSPRIPSAFIMAGYGASGTTPFAGQFGDTPGACFKRFEESVYSVADVERVIALGLYGGGMPASEALDVLKQHVTGKPLIASAIVAHEVLAGLFVGNLDAA